VDTWGCGWYLPTRPVACGLPGSWDEVPLGWVEWVQSVSEESCLLLPVCGL
jgi:hypothetical protein